MTHPIHPIGFWSSQDKRAEIKKANPTFGIGEIGKEGGAMWQALKAKGETDKDWKKYTDMAAKDKKRYEAGLPPPPSYGGSSSYVPGGRAEKPAHFLWHMEIQLIEAAPMLTMAG